LALLYIIIQDQDQYVDQAACQLLRDAQAGNTAGDGVEGKTGLFSAEDGAPTPSQRLGAEDDGLQRIYFESRPVRPGEVEDEQHFGG
jgi:hypothetical protein